MASAIPQTKYISPQEYLALERKAEQKSEFYAGEMFLMAGASESHNLIVANVVAELSTQLKSRPRKVYPSDMRLKVEKSGLYTYPDVTVVCDEAKFDDKHSDILLNPVVIVEVLSESTEGYDRGKKFEHYRRIASLQEYVLISQTHALVEQYVKQNDGNWLFSEACNTDGIVTLPSVECQLALSEIYDKVEFDAPEVPASDSPEK